MHGILDVLAKVDPERNGIDVDVHRVGAERGTQSLRQHGGHIGRIVTTVGDEDASHERISPCVSLKLRRWRVPWHFGHHPNW